MKEVLLQALDALKFAYNDCESDCVRDEKIDPAINAIEAELAKPDRSGQSQRQKDLANADKEYSDWLNGR
jgi:hypothetical protein